jgi:hypothetical protein
MSEVRLWWDANPETDIAGYKLYWGKATGTYNAVGSPKNMGNVLQGGADIDETATWHFALTAYNTSGLESDHSSEAIQAIALGLAAGKAN